MARVLDPPERRMRGTWAVLSDDEPRRFKGVLDRGILALDLDRNDDPPRWQSGGIIELIEEEAPAAVAPEGLFARLRRALIG